MRVAALAAPLVGGAGKLVQKPASLRTSAIAATTKGKAMIVMIVRLQARSNLLAARLEERSSPPARVTQDGVDTGSGRPVAMLRIVAVPCRAARCAV